MRDGSLLSTFTYVEYGDDLNFDGGYKSQQDDEEDENDDEY